MAKTKIHYQPEPAEPRDLSKKNFLRHLGTFIIIMIALVLINYWTTPTTWWVQWVALGWAISIAFQFWRIFVVREH